MWQAILWLHLIAMAFFVGGQIMLGAAIVPVLRGVGDGEPMRAVARRFGWGSLIALTVLLATGAAMATHFHLWKTPEIHTKLTLFLVAGVSILIHMRKPKLHALNAVILLSSLAAVWLGVSIAVPV